MPRRRSLPSRPGRRGQVLKRSEDVAWNEASAKRRMSLAAVKQLIKKIRPKERFVPPAGDIGDLKRPLWVPNRVATGSTPPPPKEGTRMIGILIAIVLAAVAYWI